MDPLKLKEKIFQKCLEYVDNRIKNARIAMNAAQDSANQESKSSAGDKYETGRAMAQIERDNNARLLDESNKLKQILDQIKIKESHINTSLGSLIFTNKGKFFLAISLGKVMVENEEFWVLSTSAPLGQLMINKKKGESFLFNKTEYKIMEVY